MKMEITLELDYDKLVKQIGKNTNYPPYDFIKINEYEYILELAVAGFQESDLIVELTDDYLLIASHYKNKYDSEQFVVRNIGRRNFKNMFRVDHSLIISKPVELEHGILRISFMKKQPILLKKQLFPVNNILNLT